MAIKTNPVPIGAEIRLEISQWMPVLKIRFLFFVAQIMATGNAAHIIASQTVLAFVKKIQTKISVIATRLIIRQKP